MMHDYALLAAWLAGACVAPDSFIVAATGAAALGMIYLQHAMQTNEAQDHPVQIAGQGQGICLFCPGLHSNISKSSRSQPVLDLAEQFASVVLFDYTPGATGVDSLVEDAMNMLLMCGGPGECTIAGHSMGAAVAVHTAARSRKAGWFGRIDLILFAPPANTTDGGIELPFVELLAVKVFAPNMDLAEMVKTMGAPATLVLVHAVDDEVISVNHSRLIASAAKSVGIEVHYSELKIGGHRLLRQSRP